MFIWVKHMNQTESHNFSLLLQKYMRDIRPTDRLPEQDMRPVLMGLFGEVGSIMAPAKKLHREKEAYPSYQAAVEEEFGDALWYFAVLVRRLGYDFASIFLEAFDARQSTMFSADDTTSTSPPDPIAATSSLVLLDDALVALGTAASALLLLEDHPEQPLVLLHTFAQKYLLAINVSKVDFRLIVNRNLSKVRGRFLVPDPNTLPTFDFGFHEDERLPEKFEILIKQRSNGQSCLQWNGVFIGDPLTDNIGDPDGFRFHDIFHFSHAAILHWSPTFRALIKHKRKSDRAIEEAQDSGRAIVVEEGLTAWLFARSKDLNLFDNQTSVSFDLLKTVHQFVRGYEVEACPLKLWEDAILQGYKVFRQVRAHQGGIITGCRKDRTLAFRPIN